MDEIRILPLTPDRIGDFEAVLGPQGACYGCWCTYFRLPPKARATLSGEERHALMIARIQAGPPPGLLAYRGAEPLGWMQIGPRADVPQWNNARRVSAPLPDGPADDPAVWAVSCFFLRSAARGLGLSHALVAAGIGFARSNGARLLEAAPMVKAKQSKSTTLFVGSAAVFQKAGFQTVAQVKEGRPLMRLVL